VLLCGKNTKYSRNDTIFKIGDYAKAIAHAKNQCTMNKEKSEDRKFKTRHKSSHKVNPKQKNHGKPNSSGSIFSTPTKPKVNLRTVRAQKRGKCPVRVGWVCWSFAFNTAGLVAQHERKLFHTKKKKVNLKLGKGGFWITETVKIVNSGQDSNPYNEVINLTCSSHTVEIHFFFF